MNKNIKLILLFSLTFLSVISCTTEKSDKKIIISDTKISIPIDSKTEALTKDLQFTEINKKPILIIQNGDNEIIFYNIKNLEKEHSILFKTEGLNAIQRLGGFHFINSDTIIVHEMNKLNLALINRKGEILKKFDLSELKNNLGNKVAAYPLFTAPTNEIFIENNYLYFRLYQNFAPRTFEELKKRPVMTKIKINNNGKGELLELKYPNELDAGNNNYFDIHCSHINDGNRSVFSFFGSSYIYFTNDYKQLNKKNCKSKYHTKKIKPYLPFASTGMEKLNNNIKRPSYRNLFYDKYNNVYYRFFYPGYDDFNKDEDKFNLVKFQKQFSVMVLDENFDIIDEILMPKNTYNMRMAFVSPKGLWISTNHIKNPDFEEDFLKFTLLELVDN